MEKSDKIVITAQDIEKMNVRSVPDLLNQILGVNAGESSISLRGSYMVKVILDGRTINDPNSGHRAVKWDMVSVDNIERIEIYKGGGSVEFGDNSSDGVIYITTKRAKGSHGKLKTYGGNLGTGNCSMNYTMKWIWLRLGFQRALKRVMVIERMDKEKKRKIPMRLHEHYLYEPGLNILAGLKIEF